MSVKVAKAEVADVQVQVRAPATLFPRQQANLSTRLTASIERLNVRKGDDVAKGQILVVLQDQDLMAQREEAEASLADAEASLQKVSAGTLPTDIERARGQIVSTEAALHQAETLYERRKQLFQEGAIPQRDLLASQTEWTQAKSNHEVARRSLELIETQSRDKDIRIAESRVAQARAKLHGAEAQLQFAELRSPFAGTITEQFLYPGDMAKPEVPVFTVMDLSIVVARAQVPEAEASAIHTGQRARFASADFGDETFEGRVTVVNRAVDTSRRTVEVWCEIPNPHRLRAGVFGNLAIFTATVPKSVVVPLAAIQFVEGTHQGTVMVVDAQGTAHRRDILAGDVFQGRVQVVQGLRPDETVITEGGYGLPEGTAVKVGGGKQP